MRSAARLVWAVAGGVSLGLGVVGVFVPMLPTTPFVLLTAYCWARASRRLYGALMAHPWAGRVVRDYRERRGMARSVKAGTLVALWATVCGSAGVMVWRWAAAGRALWPWRWLVLAGLAAVAVGVTRHVAGLRTLEDGVRSCRGGGGGGGRP